MLIAQYKDNLQFMTMKLFKKNEEWDFKSVMESIM